MKKLIFLCLLQLAATFAQAKVDFTATAAETSVEAGASLEITAKFSVPKGSHIYAQKTDAGLPTEIKAEMPAGWTLEKIEFPRPEKFEFMSVQASGYSGDFDVSVFVQAPDQAPDGTQKITLSASWLECGKICVPDGGSADVYVSVSGGISRGGGFWAAVLGAVLGGIILNAMPCVFPVIGLKVMSFAASAGSSKLAVVKNGVFFSLGILSTFAFLSVFLAVAKAAGASAGWGFQLQNPDFSATMAAVFWLVALNFAGVWEFGGSIGSAAAGVDARKKGAFVSNFLAGMLAVLVASPCVAPFMASAMGFALAAEASAAETVAIVTAVGVGMALPYVCLSAFPSLVKKLPKSGNWLVVLKRTLSVPLFASAAWLAAVYVGQGGNVFAVCFAATFLAAAAAIWGKFATPMQTPLKRAAAVAVCALLFAAATVVVRQTLTDAAQSAEAAVSAENTWSPERVEELRKSGRPVFVVFTASWCITCQYNKQILETDTVREAFARKNVAVLVADWTNKNDAIARELKKYSRAGVPLYLLYPSAPDKRPEILPAILTPSAVTEAVDKLAQ